MQKYSDVVLSAVGAPVSGAVITVTTYPDGAAATIFAADGGPSVASVTTNVNGRFSFYAANGHYSILVSGTGITPVTYNDVVLYDPADNGSVIVRWIRSATGAVKRWISDKLADTVSVKDFGAVGDGTADDTAAIQAAMNYAGSARTVFFPAGAYLVSAALTLVNGCKLKGDGDVTGSSGSALIVNSANYSNASFHMFIKPSGLFQSAVFEDMRFLGGGNHFYFDLSSGSAYKIKWDNCVFQDAQGAHIAAPNSTGGNGLLVCRHRGCSVINSSGISSSGPINATEISGGSWENMRGPVLYVGDTGSYPNLKFAFERNRIEGLYSGVAKTAFPVIQLDGKTYGASIADNYHEDTFSKLLKVTNSRGVIYARNTHTDSAATVGSVDITDSQVSMTDNYSLVGVTVGLSGSNSNIPRFHGNQGYSITSLYGKTTAVDDPVLIGSGGISLAAYPGLYKGEIAKLKRLSVPVTTATYFDVFTITSGSTAVLGSRAAVTIKATLLFDVIDSTGGANLISAQDVLLTAYANAGGTMAGFVTVAGSHGAATVTVRVKAGATATQLVFECAVTNAGLAYNTGSKLVALYSYVADESNSSGLTLA